ncbi:MAG: DUF6220 domain-containing protein [Chloroflexota bacterium]|nr:DUF6220 domain-containing protein [Chloroflexota bacterium]
MAHPAQAAASPDRGSLTPTAYFARLAYGVAAWLFVACVVVQVFLAGYAVMAGSTFEVHRSFGYTFGWLTLVLLALALVGRLTRNRVWLTVLVLVLFTLQSVFVAFRASIPMVAALHPVNALAIFWIALWLARHTGIRETRSERRARLAAPADD